MELRKRARDVLEWKWNYAVGIFVYIVTFPIRN